MLIQHRYFQRLRHITQLGLTYVVYPGATHSRFQHSIGAMFLMQKAIETLQNKGVVISRMEEEAVLAAILLHDIGHTAFSHALEYFFVPNCSHEDFSMLIIESLNRQLGGRLDLTIAILTDSYERHFFHQLVSSQLDVDRLDYLNRDSFYTGVAEGVIGSERIIQMLNVYSNSLVAESKAVYSIEKFIISRRLMYWQVYLHKTVHVAEQMLISVLSRVRYLYSLGVEVFLTPSLSFFFSTQRQISDFELCGNLEHYMDITDHSIWFCIQRWQGHEDKVLSELSRRLYQRNLFKIEVSEQSFEEAYLSQIAERVRNCLHISVADSQYFVFHGEMVNRAYNAKMESILIMDKQGLVRPLEDLSDHLNHRTLSETVSKYFLCYPKDIL